MGRNGFLYQSAKDNLKWEHLSIKKWIFTIMEIGIYLVLDEKEWKKTNSVKHTHDDMSKTLLLAFGNGKKERMRHG